MQTFGKSFYLCKYAEAPYRSSRFVWLWKNLYFFQILISMDAEQFVQFGTTVCSLYCPAFSGLPWCSLGTAEMKPPTDLFSPLLENCHFAPLPSSEQATSSHYLLHITRNEHDATTWRMMDAPSKHARQWKILCFQPQSTIWTKLWTYRLRILTSAYP